MGAVVVVLIVLISLGFMGRESKPDVPKEELCKPQLVTSTPSGLKLYKVDSACPDVNDDVYFSDRGTTYTERVGKVFSTKQIPNE